MIFHEPPPRADPRTPAERSRAEPAGRPRVEERPAAETPFQEALRQIRESLEEAQREQDGLPSNRPAPAPTRVPTSTVPMSKVPKSSEVPKSRVPKSRVPASKVPKPAVVPPARVSQSAHFQHERHGFGRREPAVGGELRAPAGLWRAAGQEEAGRVRSARPAPRRRARAAGRRDDARDAARAPPPPRFCSRGRRAVRDPGPAEKPPAPALVGTALPETATPRPAPLDRQRPGEKSYQSGCLLGDRSVGVWSRRRDESKRQRAQQADSASLSLRFLLSSPHREQSTRMWYQARVRPPRPF